MMFRGEDGEMREFEIISTRERESGKIIIFNYFLFEYRAKGQMLIATPLISSDLHISVL